MQAFRPFSKAELEKNHEFSPQVFTSLELKLWNELALTLWDEFKEEAQSRRRIHYYLRIFFWCRQLLETTTPKQAPLLIAVNGPRGSGKTSLCRYLLALFAQVNRRVLSLSIDDFYLTRRAQLALAAAFPDNSLLQQRGYPGTHELSLAHATLKALKDPEANAAIAIPRYDKSLHAGQGDRLPRERWRLSQGPYDLLLFEGWMLGFSPLADSSIPEPQLKTINHLLKNYQGWQQYFDAFIALKPSQILDIQDWRVEAEKKQQAQGQASLSPGEIRAYIAKFIPAYELYLPTLDQYQALGKNFLSLTLAKDRLPMGI